LKRGSGVGEAVAIAMHDKLGGRAAKSRRKCYMNFTDYLFVFAPSTFIVRKKVKTAPETFNTFRPSWITCHESFS